MEKDMLARGLKRSDAQDPAVWMLGCKNRPSPSRWKNKPDFRKTKLLINTPGTSGLIYP